jgi:(+)-trans-carveol dehydrogenase
MRGLAVELAPHSIRVNTVHPTTVDTPMVHDPRLRKLFLPEIENPTKEDAANLLQRLNALPIPWVEAVDITNAVLFLASDESRYITGVQLPVEAGSTMPFRVPNS